MLRPALDDHGAALAEAVESSDELEDALTTAIIVAASADEEELEHLTDSAANLVRAADGLSTDGAADLGTDLGENADDLSASLDTVLELEREGQLDDLVELSTAFTESLSAEDLEELSGGSRRAAPNSWTRSTSSWTSSGRDSSRISFVSRRRSPTSRWTTTPLGG